MEVTKSLSPRKTVSKFARTDICLSYDKFRADRYVLLCGPMFVPALVLSQPQFHGEISPRFGTDLCFTDIYKRRILICSSGNSSYLIYSWSVRLLMFSDKVKDQKDSPNVGLIKTNSISQFSGFFFLKGACMYELLHLLLF